MTARQLRLEDELEALYQQGGDDPDFISVLRHVTVAGDTELADLIDAEGRLRLRRKKSISLDRYSSAIPNLASRPEPLDAAIDMALRSLARDGRADAESIHQLISVHPQFEAAIRDAAALNNAIWSTRNVQQHVGAVISKELPSDWGPRIESGQQRYELRELLGQGAFGQVYLAIDRRLSEAGHPALVSIKVLPGEARSSLARQQIVDEATKARRINHPNVARVIDRGVSDLNEDYIVYEFVDGGDLLQWARPHVKVLEVNQVVQLVMKIARGVHAAHMAGLVHCDLKPNNIVVTAQGEPKITDFGISVRSDEQSGSADDQGTDHQEPVGNLAFMSPQQYRMEPGALTIPSDIYALGGILYWLLTGILPNGSTPEEIRLTHRAAEETRPPPSIRRHRVGVDHDLDAICQRAMSAEPEDRFGSAAQLADSLQAWLRREPLVWTDPSLFHRLGLWCRRRPALAASLALIIVIVSTAGVALEQLASVARQNRFDAAVAEAGLEKEEELRQQFRANLRQILMRIKVSQDAGLERDVLIGIWAVEWISGPTTLGSGPEWLELWDMRIEVVRDLLAEAQSKGHDNTFHTMIWESALGFWLINDREYVEAESLLASNLIKSRARLDPDDPWLVQVQALQSCALVGRFATETSPFDRSPENVQALHTAATSLEHGQQVLSQDNPGSPVHRLVLEYLRQLNSPVLLDRPERMAQIQTLIEALSE